MSDDLKAFQDWVMNVLDNKSFDEWTKVTYIRNRILANRKEQEKKDEPVAYKSSEPAPIQTLS